mmetsp:Transcript_10033/g.30646  ORF Transcript_10033/g.30646 Transcript_10033/m.30646 type:complete len:174 (-) Transcript_10033:2115-2636(-)
MGPRSRRRVRLAFLFSACETIAPFLATRLRRAPFGAQVHVLHELFRPPGPTHVPLVHPLLEGSGSSQTEPHPRLPADVRRKDSSARTQARLCLLVKSFTATCVPYELPTGEDKDDNTLLVRLSLTQLYTQARGAADVPGEKLTEQREQQLSTSARASAATIGAVDCSRAHQRL